eukprot:570391-Rhodomonas_salina.1
MLRDDSSSDSSLLLEDGSSSAPSLNASLEVDSSSTSPVVPAADSTSSPEPSESNPGSSAAAALGAAAASQSAPDREHTPPMSTSHWHEAVRWLMQNLRCFLDVNLRFRAHASTTKLSAKTAPLWHACVDSLLVFVDKHNPESSTYQALILLFEHLPALVLAVPGQVRGHVKDKLISKHCRLFLNGSWSKLFTPYAPPQANSRKKGKPQDPSKQAAAVATNKHERGRQAPQRSQAPRPMSLASASQRRANLATSQFAEGDLHRAVRTLLSSGIYKADSFAELVREAQEKFPH